MGATTDPAPKISAASASEVGERKDNSPVLLFDTSLSIHEWLKMGITLNIDLELIDQLYTTFIIVAVVSYVVFWSVKYGVDYLTVIHRYFTRPKVTATLYFIWQVVRSLVLLEFISITLVTQPKVPFTLAIY